MSDDRDRGSALLMVMVLMVVGGIIATGLLTYSQAVIRARPALHERVAGAEAVKSGTRIAITLQREFGPSGCFADSVQWTIASTPVTATCSTVSSYTTGRGRLGSVITANSGSPSNLVTPTWAGNVSQALAGEATINTGAMGASTSVSLVRGTGSSFTWNASALPWWQQVGDNNGVSWQYPSLPQIPSYSRPGSQASIGTCQLYFPGRYLGTTPLTLNGGTHYFASGVYYFERPIVITGGAQVVFGEGLYAGCAVDAYAAWASTAPKSHEITGKGATILLGDIATLTVQESSVRINRRVSTASTRGSEGVAIRTVNFGQSTTAVTVPADTVLLPDGTRHVSHIDARTCDGVGRRCAPQRHERRLESFPCRRIHLRAQCGCPHHGDIGELRGVHVQGNGGHAHRALAHASTRNRRLVRQRDRVGDHPTQGAAHGGRNNRRTFRPIDGHHRGAHRSQLRDQLVGHRSLTEPDQDKTARATRSVPNAVRMARYMRPVAAITAEYDFSRSARNVTTPRMPVVTAHAAQNHPN